MAGTATRGIVNAPATAVWEAVKSFTGLDAIIPEMITSCELEGSGVGAKRTLTLADGAVIVEELELLDEDTKTMGYTILSSPLPIDRYHATMTVSALSDATCQISWQSTFVAKGAPEAVGVEIADGIYAAGLAGIAKAFES